jgi:hypothetical protein
MYCNLKGLSNCMSYNAVVLSNASGNVSFMNGTYVLNGQQNSKNKYTSAAKEIVWTGSQWIIRSTSPLLTIYNSSENVEFPWQVQSWSGGLFGSDITLTPTDPIAPSQPTFGLPAESVALITSRFGTVANFLRLRNLGQI